MMQLAPRFLRKLVPERGSLTELASRGVAWSTLDFGSQMAIRLISTLVLTRLLTPDAFGLMSLATVFISGLALVSEFGIRASVVRSARGDDVAFLRTAWTLQALRGFLLTLVAALLAWPMARFYEEPMLWPMISVLALMTTIEGLGSISMARANRELQLRVLTLMNIGVQAVNTTVTIAAAWLTGSVWALVIGVLVGRTLKLILSFLVLPPFPHRFQLERDAVWEMLTFGGWLLLATLFTYFGGQGVVMIYGALIDTELLGLIVIAGTIGWALGELVLRLLSNVAFPTLSKINRERPEDLRRALARIQKAIVFGIIPLFILLSALARPIIDLLYDPRYALAGTFLSLQALNGALGILAAPYQSLQMAMGHSRIHAIVMWWTVTFNIIGIVGGFHIGGPIVMVAGAGAGGLAGTLIAMWFAHKRGAANPRYDATAIAILLLVYAFMLHTAIGADMSMTP